MRLVPGRFFAYWGIALYGFDVPVMTAYQSLPNNLPTFLLCHLLNMAETYHCAASANGSLAAMNRNFFATASDANKTTMDSLENVLNQPYAGEVIQKH